jgi:hypothetical protein
VRRLVLSLLVAGSFAVVAGDAFAAEIIRQDDRGRTIRFDVRADGVDVDWYADLLRRAAHGDEISSVTVQIVTFDEVRSTCGPSAGGCYSGRMNVMVVPAGRDDRVAHTLLHEYAHHVDSSYAHGGIPEPNGTPLWWRARSMSALVAIHSVAFDYSLGWNRSIGEIFAEDYARIHHGSEYRIPWLQPPDEIVRQSLLADFGLAQPPTAAPPPPAIRPVVVVRRGTLAPRAAVSIPFGLLGPGRRVTFTAAVAGTTRPGLRARLEVVCGRRVGAGVLRRGRLRATVDVPNLGPADCHARLVSTSAVPHRYTLTLRLAVSV